jgi:hypothetical protein
MSELELTPPKSGLFPTFLNHPDLSTRCGTAEERRQIKCRSLTSFGMTGVRLFASE